jgi:hypothetical protein
MVVLIFFIVLFFNNYAANVYLKIPTCNHRLFFAPSRLLFAGYPVLFVFGNNRLRLLYQQYLETRSGNTLYQTLLSRFVYELAGINGIKFSLQVFAVRFNSFSADTKRIPYLHTGKPMSHIL